MTLAIGDPQWPRVVFDSDGCYDWVYPSRGAARCVVVKHPVLALEMHGVKLVSVEVKKRDAPDLPRGWCWDTPEAVSCALRRLVGCPW